MPDDWRNNRHKGNLEVISNLSDVKLCIIGLGYVGLPLAVEFGKKVPTIGFDINAARIDDLRKGIDQTMEVSSTQLSQSSKLIFSSESDVLQAANVFYHYCSYANRLQSQT